MALPETAAAEILFRRRDAVEARPIPDGAVLVDMQSGRCFELNRVGAEVWAMLAAPMSATGLGASIASRYAISPDAVTRDVEALLAQLRRESLVDEAPGAERPPP